MNNDLMQAAGPQLDEGLNLLDLAVPLARHARLLILVPLLAGAAALGASYLIPPTYTAATTFLPPQQSQSASAMASLGALSGLAAAAGAIKTPGDQFISLMQSASVTDRLVDAFKLRDVYQVRYRFEARGELLRNTRMSLGRKDGLVTVEVDDRSPQRAADMANRFVDELRRVTGELALTEAQQRRMFFEAELKQTKDRLAAAQRAVEQSGFDPGALRAEPRAAAEGYARLKAETTAAEVRLQTLRRGLADNTPEVQQQLTLVGALRQQLSRLETNAKAPSDADYVGKYREFKYQETLFDLFSRQYEMARLDESRDGGLIQVVDPATVPEWKSKPKRSVIALEAAASAAVLLVAALLIRQGWRLGAERPGSAERVARLRAAWRGH